MDFNCKFGGAMYMVRLALILYGIILRELFEMS